MAWAVTADVDRFDDAVQWFLKRTVVPSDVGHAMESDAQARSFWIGASLQLDQVERVFDSIDKAIADGTPFEEWRKSVRETLRDPVHAETVFHNATQRAYNAGRWRQMNQPDVLAFKPYLMYDAILDSRTTDHICRPRAKTILHALDAWWKTNWPPLHHRCRSGVRNLTEAAAAARGISETPPETEEPGSWGRTPEVDAPWKPTLVKTAQKLKDAILRKAEKALPRKPRRSKKPKEPPPEHTPEHWIPQYQERYGEHAAPTVAWGRAAMERGLDMTLADVEQLLERSKSPGATKSLRRVSNLARTRSLKPTATLREIGEHVPAARILASTAGHLRGIEARPWDRDDVQDAHGRSGIRFYNEFLDQRVRMPGDRPGSSLDDANDRLDAYSFELRNDRGYQVDGSMVVYDNSSIFVHETGHAIEYLNPIAMRSATAFLRARTAGLPVQRLRELEPGRNYKPDEVAVKDDFVTPYIGKVYPSRAHRPDDPWTEVTAMGVELVHGDTSWATQESAITKDPDFWFWALGILAGR